MKLIPLLSPFHFLIQALSNNCSSCFIPCSFQWFDPPYKIQLLWHALWEEDISSLVVLSDLSLLISYKGHKPTRAIFPCNNQSAHTWKRKSIAMKGQRNRLRRNHRKKRMYFHAPASGFVIRLGKSGQNSQVIQTNPTECHNEALLWRWRKLRGGHEWFFG